MSSKESILISSRREFLKLCAAIPTALALPFGPKVGTLLGPKMFSPTVGEQKMTQYVKGRRFPSICVYCAGGCGVTLTSVNGKVIEAEGDPIHPINNGKTCSKLAAYLQLINSDRRLTQPLMRTNPNKGVDQDPGWVPISWDQAFDIIAQKVVEAVQTHDYVHEEAVGGNVAWIILLD